MEYSRCKSSGFKVMLNKPRDVGVVFQYKYGLAQTGMPFTGGQWNSIAEGRSESLTD
jgi:hypothetical protein